jgi:hypothetical protein
VIVGFKPLVVWRGRPPGGVVALDPQGRQEPGHGAAVADQPPSPVVAQLEAETVADRLHVSVAHQRFAHLADGVGTQDLAPLAAAERGPAAKVGDGRPELASRRHRHRVVRRLRQQHVRPGMHSEAAGMRRFGKRRRPGHPKGLEDLAAQGGGPARPAHASHQLAQHREPQVGVVEPSSGAVAHRGLVERAGQVRPWPARRPLPPRAGRLGGEPRRVGQQLGDGPVAHRGPWQVRLKRVGQVQPALVPQP